MLTALFGIEDGSLNLAVNLLVLLLVVVWLSLVYWTWADARRRIADPVLITTATVASLIPFIGTVIYTILRPPEFLDDVRERELETQASELRLRHLTAQSCPRCEHPIERSWLRCPECQQRLKDPCRSCSRPVDPRWSICPYCETPMQSSRSRQRSRTSASGSQAADRTRSEGSSGRRKAASEVAPKRPPRSERKPSSGNDSRAADGGGSDSASAGDKPPRPPRRRSTTSS
jgi:hypothetical protein